MSNFWLALVGPQDACSVEEQIDSGVVVRLDDVANYLDGSPRLVSAMDRHSLYELWYWVDDVVEILDFPRRREVPAPTFFGLLDEAQELGEQLEAEGLDCDEVERRVRELVRRRVAEYFDESDG